MTKKSRDNVVPFPAKRWDGNEPELNPRDFLEALLKDIDRGLYTPQGMLIAFVQADEEGTIHYPFVAVNLSPLEGAGLAARMLKELS